MVQRMHFARHLPIRLARLLTGLFAVALLLPGCNSDGKPGPRNAGSGLSDEQRENLKRYEALKQGAMENVKQRAFKKALLKLDKALLLAGEIYSGGRHPLLAETTGLQAQVLGAMGRFDLAAAALERELKRWKAVLYRGDNIVFAECLHRIGWAYFLAGDLDRAKRFLKMAVEMKRKTLTDTRTQLGKRYVHESRAPREPGLANTLHALGLIQWKQKAHAEAVGLLAEAVQLRRKHLQPGHLKLMQSLLNLAQLREITGKYALAEKLYQELVTRLRKRARPATTFLGAALKNLADVNRRTGKLAEAEQNYKLAQKLVSEAQRFANKDTYLALIDSSLAMVYMQTKRGAEAEKLLKGALVVFEKNPKQHAPGVVRCHVQLAKLYRQTKRLADATKAARAALNAARQHMGHNTYTYARASAELAEVYVAQGAKDQAAKILLRAFTSVHKLYGSNHPRTKRMRTRLLELYKALRWKQKAAALPQ